MESRRLPSGELFLNVDYINWFDVVGGNSAVGGSIRRVDNVIILGFASWTDRTLIGPGDMLTPGILAEVGVSHLDDVRSSLSSAASSNADVQPDGTFPGVTFTPQRLDVQLGDTVSVEVAMPTTEFGGLYDLNLLIPPQFQLASDPVCISDAESCVNFEPVVIPQLDGSIAIVISGYYGLSEPGRFAVELDVVDVPQAGGPRVGISAQLVFYTRHVEHEPIDTWLEVNYELDGRHGVGMSSIGVQYV